MAFAYSADPELDDVPHVPVPDPVHDESSMMLSFRQIEDMMLACNRDRCSCASRLQNMVNWCNSAPHPGVVYNNASNTNHFHIYESTDLEPIKLEFASFDVEAVVRIDNPMLSFGHNQYCGGIEGGANVKTLYHTTRGDVHSILTSGLDKSKSTVGYFGKALYFSDSPTKANDYSPARGYNDSIRLMLRCKVALGKTHVFTVGDYNKRLVGPPNGCNSVLGFIRRADEYAVYDNSAVLVAELVFYRVKDALPELTVPLVVPPRTPIGSVVFITGKLSEFFSRLQRSTSTPDEEKQTRRLITRVLRKQIDIDMFILEIRLVLRKVPPPADLIRLLRQELDAVVYP